MSRRKNPVEFELLGVKYTQQTLRDLDYKLRKKIVQAAARKGIGVLRTASRRTAPTDKGLLRRQLTTSVKTDRGTGTVSAVLKPKRTKSQKRKGFVHSGHYHHIVIGGSQPHVIRGGVIGGNYYSEINHPGARANPWMDAVIARSSRAALAAFQKTLRERTDTEARKERTMQPPGAR